MEPRHAKAVRLDPAFERHVRLGKLVVQTAVHGHRERTGRKHRRFDFALTGRRSRERLAAFNRPEPGPRREVPRKWTAVERNSDLLAVAEDLAEALRHRRLQLGAWNAAANDQHWLGGNVASFDRQSGHRGSPVPDVGGSRKCETGRRMGRWCRSARDGARAPRGDAPASAVER